MNISDHLTLKEVTKSNTAIRNGISNEPTPEHLENLKRVALHIFEPIRIHFNKAVGISSGYRSKALNTKVKGSISSQHCKGEALDIDADIYDNGITNKEIFHYIKDNLDFDQLIWEFGNDDEPDWVHASFTILKTNRKQILRTTPGGKYINWK